MRAIPLCKSNLMLKTNLLERMNLDAQNHLKTAIIYYLQSFESISKCVEVVEKKKEKWVWISSFYFCYASTW